MPNRTVPGTRNRWRSRSHDEAHRNDADAHDDVPHDADFVDTQSGLVELLSELERDGAFAYDSEFISESSYFPKLCLVQVASQNRIALIDPLAGLDLTPFWELLANPGVLKIVHAGAQDIEPVVRHLCRPAANVLDTQIAAAFAGLPYPISLKKLIAELTGSRLGRDLGFSNWDQRPLSDSQLRYAADDVRYLPEAVEELLVRLDALGHRAAAMEECNAACAPELFRFDPDTQFLRVRGSGALPPRSMAILRELTLWRDGCARTADLPPRAFLKDEVLIALVTDPVKSLQRLSEVRSFPKGLLKSEGDAVVGATLRGIEAPPIAIAGGAETEPVPAEKFGADGFFAVFQSLCFGLALDPGMVANRKQVGEFLRHASSGGDAVPPMLLNRWRGRLVGEMLVGALRGECALEFNWHQGVLRAASR